MENNHANWHPNRSDADPTETRIVLTQLSCFFARDKKLRKSRLCRSAVLEGGEVRKVCTSMTHMQTQT